MPCLCCASARCRSSFSEGRAIALTAGRTAASARLIEGPITPGLLRFALPLLMSNLLHALAATWAAAWAGQVLGANALTAVATGSVLMLMLMGAVMGIGTAAAVAIGQSLGAGDVGAVKRVVGTSLAFVMGFGVAAAAAGWLLTPSIIGWMGTPEPSRAFAITHLRATCLSMPSIFTYLVMVMMMRGTGDSKTPFMFTLLWIGLTGLLGPLLLTGAYRAPHLGIAGLGLGSLMANAVALAALVLHVYRHRLPIALHGADLRHLRLDPILLSLLLRRGLPQAMETIIVQGAYFVMLAMVNAHGAATAAAYAGAAQLWAYVQLPANALAASMSAMAAMNIGAGRWNRVEGIALRGCLASLVVSGAVMALVFALGPLPLRLFIPQGGEVLALAWHINLIVLWGWIALSASMGLFGVMRANGATLAPMLVFAATMWFMRVPFAWGLQPWLGADAIWWSFPFSAMCCAVMALAWHRWGGWRSRGLMLAELNELPAAGDESRLGE